MGDPEKAKQRSLKDAGVTTPYKISLAYASTADAGTTSR